MASRPHEMGGDPIRAHCEQFASYYMEAMLVTSVDRLQMEFDREYAPVDYIDSWVTFNSIDRGLLEHLAGLDMDGPVLYLFLSLSPQGPRRCCWGKVVKFLPFDL